MSTRAAQLANKRDEIQRLAEQRVLHIETLPSGRIRVFGVGVDIRVVDLAYLSSYDLLPATR